MKKLLPFLARPPILLMLALFIFLTLCHVCWEIFFPKTERQPILLFTVALIGLLAASVSAIPEFIQERRRQRAMTGQLAAEIEQALEQMGEGMLGATDRLLRKPWVLVLGTPQCGKTTALSHNEFAQRTASIRARNPLCLLWRVRGRDAVMVQPRGQVYDDNGLWRELLYWLHRRRPVDAALLLVSASELLAPGPEDGGLRSRLAERLRELGQVRSGLPLVVMVTKCDRVDGFVRFFSELSVKQREAAWGLTLDLRDYELCSARLADHLGEDAVGDKTLLDPLFNAAHESFRSALNEDEQAAALGFPMEMGVLSRQLGMFLDSLYSTHHEPGRPRLVEVCFTSAIQAEAPLPGSRHELRVQGQTLRVRPVLPGLKQSNAFFLRGALERVLDHATAASRPPLRRHIMALALSLGICAMAGFFLGRGLMAPANWLNQTEKIVRALSKPPGTMEDPTALSAELDRESNLAALLDLSDQKLTQAARLSASRFLRCRAGAQLVAPVVTLTSQEEPGRLYSDLRQASTGSKGQSHFRTYLALKTSVLLKKRLSLGSSQIECPLPSAQDREEVANYLAALWVLHTEPGIQEKLRKRIRTFMDLHLSQDQEPWPTFDIKEQELINGEQKLLNICKKNCYAEQDSGVDAAGIAEMYFNMRAQKEGLISPRPLLVGDHFLAEPGISPVYTEEGCQRLFLGEDNQWGTWLACVRGGKVDGRAPAEALRTYYLGQHAQAWKRWLAKLVLKENFSDDPQRASEQLRSFQRDLKELFTLVGRGWMQKAKKRTASPDSSGKNAADVKKAPNAPAAVEIPESCLHAQRQFAAFSYTAGLDPGDEDPEPRVVWDAWDRYDQSLTKMQTVLQDLAYWRPAPEATLQPYHSSKVALTALMDRRKRLTSALGESGPELQRLLEGVEADLLRVSRAALRHFLTENWRPIYDRSRSVLPSSGKAQGTAEIDRARKFIEENVATFAAKFIDPLDDAARREVVCARALDALTKARKPAPEAPPLPAEKPAEKPAAVSPPTITVPACEKPPQSVMISAGAAGRFRCEPSNHRCAAQPVAPSAAPPSTEAEIKAEFDDGLYPTSAVLSHAISLSKIVEAHRTGERAGWITIDLQAPRRGRDNCHVIIYLSPGMVESSPAAGPSQPTWAISVPASLSCP